MYKSFCSLFSNHKKEEEFIDEDRKAMRMHFGIKDKYLIEYFLEDVSGDDKKNYKDEDKNQIVNGCCQCHASSVICSISPNNG